MRRHVSEQKRRGGVETWARQAEGSFHSFRASASAVLREPLGLGMLRGARSLPDGQWDLGLARRARSCACRCAPGSSGEVLPGGIVRFLIAVCSDNRLVVPSIRGIECVQEQAVLNWMYFPKSRQAPEVCRDVVAVMEAAMDRIGSESLQLKSNEVLAELRAGLEARGFEVERGKRKNERIHVPVLFGRNGQLEKAFEADAWDRERGMVLEVEAGRAVANNQFLKDLFQACMMSGVDYCGIAVRNHYRGSNDFDRVCGFFDTLYASRRLQLPLKGVLIVGY